MKISLEDIPEGGLSVDLSEDGKEIERLAGALDFTIVPPVEAHLDFTKTEGNLYVTGAIKARLSFGCSRCLKEFAQDIDGHFSVFFTRAREEEREKELKAADMDVNYLEGTEIDTNDILLTQLSLEAPVKPLCSPECKGLCPRCGADLNQGECGCPKEGRIDSRFAKLKDFKLK